jgi:3-oxoadipate enol-lactonase
MYAIVNGIRMAYRQRGRGHDTALLLVHGFPLDGRMWDAQIGGLAPLVRVIAPDLRGSGRSGAPPGPYSMEQHAADLAALLDSLDIRQVVVAGLSMGGYIAFALWRRQPERVRALVLADTRAEPDSPQARANRDAAAVRVREHGAAAYADEMLPRLLAPASLTTPRIRDRARDIMAAQPVEGIVGALGGMRDRADSRDLLPGIAVPALVIVGRDDAVTPPVDARSMAGAIPGARLVEVPRAGHLSPLENSRAVNAALRGFLREIAVA